MSLSEHGLKISAVLITLNEENNIARCLSSLDFVDEVVVYDSGSQDRTLEVARQLGLFSTGKTSLKIIEGPWLGFGPTKKKATSLAAHNWILSIDADEVVSDELKKELQKLMTSEIPATAFLIPRKSYYLGRWINYGGWSPDYQLRFFDKRKWQWDEAPIHEKVIAELEGKEPIKLQQNFQHYVFKDIEDQVNTNNRYSSLQAEKMYQEGKRFNLFHFLTKPYVKFIECYYWKLGFLDGWAGFVIAVSAAYSVFLKWAKLRELEKQKES